MSAKPCPDDHELLAVASGEEATDEVRSHLDTCSDCRQRLGHLQAEVSKLRAVLGEVEIPLLAGADGPSPPTALPRPEAIGKYIILDSLGRGGQADVYRALHTGLAKEVVIKLSRRPVAPGQSDRDHLLAEGKVLAELDHPHLARVYDVDSHEGHPFLVMEYVRGRTLRQHAEEQRPTPRQAAALVAGVARALAVAHRHGVVHQDLKPKNILIDEAGQPHVIDFGMARLVQGWGDDPEQPEGGTLAYMAPEQARGEAERINARSDIFALGAVLYYLLVGQAPFRGRDGFDELDRAGRCDFDRWALHKAGVPRRLEEICLRAMAAEPADRYGRAEDLAADLERFVRRPRQVMIVAGLILGSLLTWAGWRASHKPPPEVHLPPDALCIRLLRSDETHELKSLADLHQFAPLRTGDWLQLFVEVPPGLRASVFWIDSEGQVTHLPDAGPGKSFAYPRGNDSKRLAGPAGTEVVLVCWRRGGPLGVEEVKSLWGQEKLPRLPSKSVLHVDRDGVESAEKPRYLGESRSQPNPEEAVSTRLEQLREGLCGRVDFLEGFAFPHKDGP